MLMLASFGVQHFTHSKVQRVSYPYQLVMLNGGLSFFVEERHLIPHSMAHSADTNSICMSPLIPYRTPDTHKPHSWADWNEWSSLGAKRVNRSWRFTLPQAAITLLLSLHPLHYGDEGVMRGSLFFISLPSAQYRLQLVWLPQSQPSGSTAELEYCRLNYSEIKLLCDRIAIPMKLWLIEHYSAAMTFIGKADNWLQTICACFYPELCSMHITSCFISNEYFQDVALI